MFKDFASSFCVPETFFLFFLSMEYNMFLWGGLVEREILNLLKNTSVDLDSYWPAEVSVVIFNPSNFTLDNFWYLLS